MHNLLLAKGLSKIFVKIVFFFISQATPPIFYFLLTINETVSVRMESSCFHWQRASGAGHFSFAS